MVGLIRNELKAATELVAAATGEQRRIAAAIGDRVWHAKFGPGTVETVDGNKIAVMFDAVGRKEVVDSSLERAE